MKKLTVMVIPDGASGTRQWRIPGLALRGSLALGLVVSASLGFFLFDYTQLRGLRRNFQSLAHENEGLKGEARILMHNLEEVKRSLRRVQDYSSKLSELTTLKVSKVSKETGIGPLTAGEFHTSTAAVGESVKTEAFVPLGVNLDNLAFKPVFNRLASIGDDATKQAVDLQHLLSTLSQQKSLLAAIPSLSPVEGWITSGYGTRVSPFSGERAMHYGIDVAAPIGTPVHAPADGVVIFSGAKAGFGNFVMIAHGYGVVTRYGHNHQNLVTPGQKVNRGEQIATVGSTGRTTGPHLHYEIWVNGKSDNPQKFILDMDELAIF